MFYECWEEPDGSLTFSTEEQCDDMHHKGMIATDAKLLYIISASTWEEAMTLHHQKQGWEAYKPNV